MCFALSDLILRACPHWEFENVTFSLKMHQMFSVHTVSFWRWTRQETVTWLSWTVTWLSWRHRFPKASFSKVFPSSRKRKAGDVKLLRFEERFRKAPFSWRVSVDGKPNRRYKAAFSNFSGLVGVDGANKSVYLLFCCVITGLWLWWLGARSGRQKSTRRSYCQKAVNQRTHSRQKSLTWNKVLKYRGQARPSPCNVIWRL